MWLLRTVVALLMSVILWPCEGAAQTQIAERNFEVNVDGTSVDWPSGWRSLPEGVGRYQIVFDEQAIYVVAEVNDNRIIHRSGAQPGDRFDLGVAHGPEVSRLLLVPGQSGRTRSEVRLIRGGRETLVSTATVVEMTAEDGFTIEARVPFLAIGMRDRPSEIGMVAAIVDVDQAAHPSEHVVATGNFEEPNLWPRFTFRDQFMQFVDDFARRQQVAPTIRQEWRRNVRGGSEQERLVLLDRFLIVHEASAAFSFVRFDVARPVDVLEVSFADLTGDGLNDLVARLRRGDSEVLQVTALSDRTARQLFSVEVARVHQGRRIATTAAIRERNREIVLTSSGDATPIALPALEGSEPLVVPWEFQEVRYRWNGTRFERTGQRPATGAAAPPTTAARGRREQPAVVSPPDPEVTRTIAAIWPAVESALGQNRYTHSVDANLFGGRDAESVRIYQNHLVIASVDAPQGREWQMLDLPVSGSNILSLEAADVTGDGLAELRVRIRSNATVTRGAESISIARELVWVIRVTDVRSEVVFRHELRRQGMGSVLACNLTPRRGGGLEVRPEAPQGGQAEELDLIVGRDALPIPREVTRYRWASGQFVAEP